MKSFIVLILLAFSFLFSSSAQAQKDPQPVFGKYGCTASKYSGGQVTYTPKGSFVIKANGTYTYYGSEKPSSGKFSIDKSGNLLFTGGYFNNGRAEKIDRPNKFFLTFPANPDNRWTCGLVE